ncbi:hypothetical protein A1351_02230 [Methylosinus sp. R-45379]|uniref:hypothetical protein n=1 Tax=Methylosinus sp. R-45379 TaxID=980563 RepID=UPI0007D80561|nr:hypothetical protein [Methylosinus sp. R-45379]OAI24831.1 hypothetical protein A1351_02230 [Methylosinus sp. R-45379]
MDGRDKPGHDGHSVSSGIGGGAAALHCAFLEHMITRVDGVILARYCLNLTPFDGDRSPVWESDPLPPPAIR